MPRPQKAKTEAESALESIRQDESRFQAAPGSKFALANGGSLTVNEAIQMLNHDYRPGEHSSVLADPKRWLKDPDHSKTYAWPAITDKMLSARVRSHQYRLVSPDELREDSDAPIYLQTHKGLGAEVICMYECVLVEVSEEANNTLYKNPRIEAILRATKNPAIEKFKNEVEAQSHGIAKASVEIDKK